MRIIVEVDSPEIFNKNYFVDWLYHHLNGNRGGNVEFSRNYFSGAPTNIAAVTIVETSN
jgi:hypothetical protein